MQQEAEFDLLRRLAQRPRSEQTCQMMIPFKVVESSQSGVEKRDFSGSCCDPNGDCKVKLICSKGEAWPRLKGATTSVDASPPMRTSPIPVKRCAVDRQKQSTGKTLKTKEKPKPKGSVAAAADNMKERRKRKTYTAGAHEKKKKKETMCKGDSKQVELGPPLPAGTL